MTWWEVVGLDSATAEIDEELKERVWGLDEEEAAETYVSDNHEGDAQLPKYVAVFGGKTWLRFKVYGEYSIDWHTEQIEFDD